MWLTRLGLQSLFGTIGGKLLGIRTVCPQNGNGVLKGLIVNTYWLVSQREHIRSVSMKSNAPCPLFSEEEGLRTE